MGEEGGIAFRTVLAQLLRPARDFMLSSGADTDRETDRQERQADREADRQTETDRQTDTKAKRHGQASGKLAPSDRSRRSDPGALRPSGMAGIEPAPSEPGDGCTPLSPSPTGLRRRASCSALAPSRRTRARRQHRAAFSEQTSLEAQREGEEGER